MIFNPILLIHLMSYTWGLKSVHKKMETTVRKDPENPEPSLSLQQLNL